MGPLRVHPSNPRYFADARGRPIYLTGSHNWYSLQDWQLPDRRPFDYPAHLEFLRRHNHNFMRMWAWEGTCSASDGMSGFSFDPLPYLRTGPDMALDGKPKFDLTRFDPAYFQRLRQRVVAARDRGIYVSVMLFQGWSIEQKKSFRESPWPRHPFHKENNVNGIDGDPNGSGDGEETHTLAVPTITRLQEAYVREVIDTVNDLENVLYEITNESPVATKEWQYHMIREIKAYEARKPKQHPVGMTYIYMGRAGVMDALLSSPADWISPGNDGDAYRYGDQPPAADGRKVILSDTDHFFGVGGDQKWVWKSFTRGMNPIFMDPLDDADFGAPDSLARQAAGGREERWEPARRAMGHTRTYAQRVDLAAMSPLAEVATSGYCLADPGKEYLIYLPEGSAETVDLTAAPGTGTVEWMHPITGTIAPGGTIAGGARRELTPPFAGDAVLYLRFGTG